LAVRFRTAIRWHFFAVENDGRTGPVLPAKPDLNMPPAVTTDGDWELLEPDIGEESPRAAVCVADRIKQSAARLASSLAQACRAVCPALARLAVMTVLSYGRSPDDPRRRLMPVRGFKAESEPEGALTFGIRSEALFLFNGAMRPTAKAFGVSLNPHRNASITVETCGVVQATLLLAVAQL
jgi:hypothetical protein